jgi:hypothetical protein
MEQKPKTVRVTVGDVVREMEVVDDDIVVYFNTRTGEFVPVSGEEARLVESDFADDDLPDWQKDLLPKVQEALESEDYIALPDRFEIHEWAIMRDFSASLDDEEVSTRLLNAIHGSGAFRYFRDLIREIGIENDWYRFRDEALSRIAIRWLEENGIPYNVSETDT